MTFYKYISKDNKIKILIHISQTQISHMIGPCWKELWAVQIGHGFNKKSPEDWSPAVLHQSTAALNSARMNQPHPAVPSDTS